MNEGVPSPRVAVTHPELIRPDWVEAAQRNPNRLWLDKNENSDPVMISLVYGLLSEIPQTALWGYPSLAPVYEALSRYVGTSPSTLFLGAGSDGVIRTAFEAFVSSGDVVVHTNPTFAMYGVYCKMFGANAKLVNYVRSAEGPVLNLEQLFQLIRQHQPKMVCLPNPDSPTGTVVPRQALDELVGETAKAGALLVIDEAYHPFYKESAIDYLDDYNHVLVTRTFAKAWGAAGLRVGYGVASHELISWFHRIRPMYEIGALSASVLVPLLSRAEEMEKSVARLQQGKSYFQDAMRELGFATYESHGNFFHVDFGDLQDAVYDELHPYVYYRKDFSHSCLKGYSRFSAAPVPSFEGVIEKIQGLTSC